MKKIKPAQTTASDLWKQLTEQRQELDGLDEWLNDHLIHCFSLAAAGEAVKISWQHIHEKRWAHHAFVVEMIRRGFSVQFKPNNRRSLTNINRGWYLIAIPMDHLNTNQEAA